MITLINQCYSLHWKYIQNISIVDYCFDEKVTVSFCSSGPKPTTVKDFWQMIWQENIHTIVMLTGIIEGKKVSVPGQKHKHKDTT